MPASAPAQPKAAQAAQGPGGGKSEKEKGKSEAKGQSEKGQSEENVEKGKSEEKGEKGKEKGEKGKEKGDEGKGGGKEVGEGGMAWRDVGPKPYNSSQGGLQSNAFRERMKTLHYEVAPEVPFGTFQECFALLACERNGLRYNKED
eukprot:s6005_g2.t1